MVFLGGYFWVFGLICAKTMGIIFLWGKLYMLLIRCGERVVLGYRMLDNVV